MKVQMSGEEQYLKKEKWKIKLKKKKNNVFPWLSFQAFFCKVAYRDLKVMKHLSLLLYLLPIR